MTALRNAMLRMLRDRGDEVLLALDSDVLLDPRALSDLTATGESIVSPVFWARWGMDIPGSAPALPPELAERTDLVRLAKAAGAGKRPQVWERGCYTSSDGFVSDLLWRRGLHEVGGLGAATLIHRRVVEAGVTYDPVPNLPEDMVGEDRHFCVRAVCHGVRLMASSYLPTVHCDEPAETAEYDREVAAPLEGVRWPVRWAPEGVALS